MIHSNKSSGGYKNNPNSLPSSRSTTCMYRVIRKERNIAAGFDSSLLELTIRPIHKESLMLKNLIKTNDSNNN
jgi:hypothetical protein